jgi:hypothetical protein
MSVFTTISSSALAYERKFADRYIQLAAVTEDELSATFSKEERFGGEAVMLNFIGSLEARSQLTEFERLQFAFLTHSRRMMTPQFFYVATPLDRAVTWQMVADPSSDYMSRCRQAMNRKRSSLAMDSIFADVITETLDPETGVRSTALSSFPAANKVAYNYTGGTFGQTGQGLNFDKLLRANELAFGNKVSPLSDQNESFIVPIDYTRWLGFLGQRVDVGANDELIAVNRDFLMSKDSDFSPGKSRKIGPWTFHFVHTLPTSGSDTLIPFYLPSGMKKGTGPMDAKFSEPDMMVSTKIMKVWETDGFLRAEDEKVYQIAVR